MTSVLLQRIILAILLVSAVAVTWRVLTPVRDSKEPSIASESVSSTRPVTANHDQAQDANQVASEQHPLDPVLEFAHEVLASIRTNVNDYTGKLVKRERIGGKLGGEVQMEFKIRSPKEASAGRPAQPLSVYLLFLEPWSARGREVIWVEGRNDNKLTAHEGGFKNLLRVQLDPNGMLAMIDNKYPITEVGLTKLVEKLIEKGERDRLLGPCEVRIIEGEKVGDRTCRLIQVTHPEPDDRFDFHIAQIFIDTERLIPLRYAAFMWPANSGEEPPLEEEYTYLDVQLNVGLSDIDFDPDNPAYKFP
jgi:hypothetical protein